MLLSHGWQFGTIYLQVQDQVTGVLLSVVLFLTSLAKPEITFSMPALILLRSGHLFVVISYEADWARTGLTHYSLCCKIVDQKWITHYLNYPFNRQSIICGKNEMGEGTTRNFTHLLSWRVWLINLYKTAFNFAQNVCMIQHNS